MKPFLLGVGKLTRSVSVVLTVVVVSCAPARQQDAFLPSPSVQSDLVHAIASQIKPYWVAPQGAEAEKLVTVLAWSFNPDGMLVDRPVVVSQSGISDLNQGLAQRHANLAIRAVQLAAPFHLLPRDYILWRHVAAFRFVRKLPN